MYRLKTNAIGLVEKRLARHIQDNVLPGFMEQVKSIAGFMPTLEINWETFTAYDECPLSRLRE